MPYIKIPKDLSNYKTKIIGNFTLRQVICFGGGLVLGFGSYFLLTIYCNVNSDLASWALILLCMPLFAFGIVEKNGMPLEKYIKCIIDNRIIAAYKRPYKQTNIYDYAQSYGLRSEQIEQEKEKKLHSVSSRSRKQKKQSKKGTKATISK
jgi:hypothetical protein